MKETVQERESRLRKLWQEEKTFQQSIKNRHGQKSYVFYEGPPTANGMPHAGHALGRTMKDFVARYKTMQGYQVLRKAGWDTHGLPVELEVEKQLKIRGKDEIEQYGVEKFIQKCKDSVFTYEKEWRQFTESLGYWVDMDDPYVTLDNDYIESVWNILANIHQKDLLYKGHRVVPYCPQCETSLSSHEVAQGYADVTDLSATAKFKVANSANEFFLGWTTTPWTLPANVALAVHRDMTYVKVQQQNETFIVAKTLAPTLFAEGYQVVAEVKGSDLVGVQYVAPFDFISVQKGHEVVAADFVTDKSGTGIVHIAPAYGEDDYHVIKENGFDFVHVVNEKGQYKDVIVPLAGKFVKDCDVEIVKMLAHNGRLFQKERYEHSYPHCWRCDSPLLYYAMEGWFIETTKVKEQILANNQTVEWYPDHMKNGRFGNFLENLVDWNIGRNRYWGTPLNVWVCDNCEEQKSPASLEQLRSWSEQPLAADFELHKPYVDQVTFSCSCGGTMKRTKEVIDVWFDSGSMPFAQYHYPFENEALMQSQFPADVVIEGVDQTRGWFYSLLAVSTLFTGKAPYKRVLSLGHILDENGQKMSKSKGNALNPTELINEFGADALRWALLGDSAPWNNKRFSKKTVSQTKSKVIDTFANVYSFYAMYAKIDQFEVETDFVGKRSRLDEWVLSRLNTVVAEVTNSLNAYDVTKGARAIATFLDEVSNWYVRRSRQRFWSSGMSADKKAAYHTLQEVLVKTAQLMAPFAPFMSDEVYRALVGESVHVSDFPSVNEEAIDVNLEEKMQSVLQIVELTRSIRNQVAIKTKQPLSKLTVVTSSGHRLEGLDEYSEIIADETNMKQIQFETSLQDYVTYELKLNFPVAGPKLGKLVGLVQKQVAQLSTEEVQAFVQTKKLEFSVTEGETVVLGEEDILIETRAPEGLALAEGDIFTVLLDTTLTDELKQEGFVREFIRAVQTYRKELNLPVELRVVLNIHASETVQNVLHDFDAFLYENLIIESYRFVEDTAGMERLEVESEEVYLAIQS
ncbi:isoleucine--tRNA ligase [Alkalihalobacillus pseudalcaliphilus]|uniref:isoleucine--tRNA ligase n=1 Tax=Alkalihalobacillus pseudalcaliphilus TaxID=79884 RepID=UPI000ADA711C